MGEFGTGEALMARGLVLMSRLHAEEAIVPIKQCLPGQLLLLSLEEKQAEREG